jgi:hypothetical protein
MYEWVDGENKNPLIGECEHDCSYCYVKKLKRNPTLKKRYSGTIRLDEKILKSVVREKTRFLCSCNDLFAENVPDDYIKRILKWAASQDGVEWVIQSKNPRRMMLWKTFADQISSHRENHTEECFSVFQWGTTIETNRDTSEYTKAPQMRFVDGLDFVTIEPIMEFDLYALFELLVATKPHFVNIGADSRLPKERNLPEPSMSKVMSLIRMLKKAGIEVREKENLKRITGGK